MCRFLASLTILAAGLTSLHAQTGTGTIEGTVRDPSKAVVSDATITVANLRTGVAQGRFAIPFLQPGDYSLTVEKTGFRRYRQTGIKLDVQQVLSLDVELQIGEVTAAVQVDATPPPLATSNATVATTIENKRIIDLPINGRNVLALSITVPGTAPISSGGRRLPTGTISVRDSDSRKNSAHAWLCAEATL